jgi:hypothetical protein
MPTFLPAALAALLMTAEAQAFCASVPEDSAWHATQQKTAHMLCLQRELSQATDEKAAEARWQLQFGTLAARTELMLQQQRAASMLDRWN